MTALSCAESPKKDAEIINPDSANTSGNIIVYNDVNATPDKYPYDLKNPSRKWTLSKELEEISGLVWMGKEKLLAIEDIHPKLYLLKLEKNDISIEKSVFFLEKTGKKFDLEDVAVINNKVYALYSHGDIYKIENWQSKPAVKKYSTPLSKKNNTEGLCFDPITKNLLVACKNDSYVKDEKKSTRAIYEFDLNSHQLINDPFMLIHPSDFKKATDEKLDFYPSAVAVHPITHDIYILSTKENKCLARYDYKGKILSVQFIDKSQMPQPEGICFAPDGRLFISSEGTHGNKASIFEFDYQN